MSVCLIHLQQHLGYFIWSDTLKPFSLFATILSLSTGLVFLSGCGIQASFPDTQVSTAATTASVGAIQGSDYGGHAPIVGAHVFLVEANPSANGYGHLVKSLLSSASANSNYPTAQDTTQGSPTNGMYYVTSDSTGQYQLTGDYTCDIGYPVYVYGAGGNPSSNPPTQFSAGIQITGITAAPGSGATYQPTTSEVITFTTTGQTLPYQGEQITLSGLTGSYAGLNASAGGPTLTVIPTGLGTTGFEATYTPGSTYTQSQQTYASSYPLAVQAAAPGNPGIVNMALLGVCGDTSPTNPTQTATANFTSLQYIYMNEVSTAAAAYAMSSFFQVPTYTFTVSVGGLTHNGVTVSPGVQNALGNLTATGSGTGTVTITGATISNSGYTITMSATGPVTSTDSLTFNSSDNNGSFANFISGAGLSVTSSATTSDALHISVPSGDAQALTGLQNAARNAALLYDIQGNNVGTANDGDNRIARATTPNGGNGTVPQALLNTVGNILANCVDSANLYGVTAPTASESAQCSALFGYARADGTTTGLKPYDTATAAINIAHYPGGSGTNTGYATNLFNTVPGNVPFAPNLGSAPHDFAVAITWQTPSSAISDIAIDASGDVWTVGTAGNDVVSLAPKGTFTTYTPPTGTTMGTTSSTGVTIDRSGNVFASAVLGTVEFVPGTPTGTLIGASNSANGGQIAVDGSGNLYIADDAVTGGSFANYYELSGNNYPLLNSDLVKESEAGTAAGGNFPVGPGAPNAAQNSAQGCIPAVSYLALDSSNNIWTSTPNNSLPPYAAVCRFDSAGNLQYSFAVTPNSNVGLPHQIAVDNGNNAWFAEKDQSFLYKIAAGSTGSNSGTSTASGGSLAAPKGVAIDGANTVWVSNTGYSNGNLVHYTNAATAISPTYYGGTGYGGNSYLYLSVDQSGNVWAVDNSDGILVQYIGIGTPVAQPFSAARAGVGLGAKP